MIQAPTHQAAGDPLTPEGVRRALAEEIAKAGSLTAWATARRVDKGTVSRVVNGHREPSPDILAALGLIQVARYMPARRPQGGSNAR